MVERDDEAARAFGSQESAARGWSWWRKQIAEGLVILLVLGLVTLLVIAAFNGEDVGA
jgi:hypothetical protein